MRGPYGRFRHLLYHRVNQPQPAGRSGNQQLSGCRKRYRLTQGTQQGSDLRGDFGNVLSTHRELHGNQFVLTSLAEFLDADLGDETFRNAFLDVDHHKHLIPADQRVARGHQHAVHDVDGFDRRVFFFIGVVERAGRRSLGHHQRQTGLLGEPIQHLFPLLETKHELQAFFDRLAYEVAELDLRENLGQLGVAFFDDRGLGLRSCPAKLLRPLGQQPRNPLSLIGGQLQTRGNLRVGQLLEIRRRRFAWCRRGCRWLGRCRLGRCWLGCRWLGGRSCWRSRGRSCGWGGCGRR